MTITRYYNPRTDHNRVEFHTRRIDELGIDVFKETSKGNVGGARDAADLAIKKYYENQEYKAIERREKREIDTLTAAQTANKIAQDANLLSKVAIFFSLVAIVASAWVVIATKTG